MFCVGVGSATSEQGFIWWNPDFDYAIPVDITNPVGIDYPMLINVSYDSNMQTDFGDIRFATVSGNATIPYYIDDKTDESYAYIYVLLPANETRIMMYYGNNTVDTSGSGDDVFLAFDDFETTLNTTKWGVNNLKYGYTIGGSLFTEGNYDTWNNYDSAAIYDIDNVSGAFVAETTLNYTHTSNTDMTGGFLYLKTESSYLYAGLLDAWGIITGKPAFGSSIGATAYASGQSTRAIDGVMHLKITRDASNVICIYENGLLRQTGTLAGDITDCRFVSYRFTSAYSTHNLRWSDLTLRPLVPTEPTISWGYVEFQGDVYNPPVADFITNLEVIVANSPVQFIDQSTNTPTTWFWTFGDGGNSTEDEPIHTYTTANTYTVNLTVTNADGSDTVSKMITVTVAPTPTPTPIPTPVSSRPHTIPGYSLADDPRIASWAFSGEDMGIDFLTTLFSFIVSDEYGGGGLILVVIYGAIILAICIGTGGFGPGIIATLGTIAFASVFFPEEAKIIWIFILAGGIVGMILYPFIRKV
jgi:PKD repeat protein